MYIETSIILVLLLQVSFMEIHVARPYAHMFL